MENKYNENAAALTWEIVNDSKDIGLWKLWYNENESPIEGSGIEEFIGAAQALTQDIQVIFVKRLKWFIHLARNFMTFKDREFFANGEQEFYFINICDNVELRNWDNFWKNIEDGQVFLKRLEVCRVYFNHGEGGERNKNKLSLKNHYKYTLAKEMWRDIYNQNFFYQSWSKNYCNTLLPQDEEELNYITTFDKAGFYYCNQDYSKKVIEKIYRYDISSAYLSYLSRKEFPMEQFSYTENPEEMKKIITEGYCCWYGTFSFYKMQYKYENGIMMDLSRFGVPIETELCSWQLLLTDVDYQWVKILFNWDKCYLPSRLYYTRKKILDYRYHQAFSYLYNAKKPQKKGTFAKEIYKFRAQEVFGQPIKALDYCSKTIYDEETNSFVAVPKDEKSFEQIKFELSKRGIPMYVGLWVAAYSRLEFATVLSKIGFDNVIYGDTDSITFIGEEGVKIIEEHNKKIIEEKAKVFKRTRVVIDNDLGQWLNEGEFRNFKFIANKTYICEKLQEDGTWDLVVKAAGANGDNIKRYLLSRKNPFSSFNIYMEVPQMRYTIEKDDNTIKLVYDKKIDREELFKYQRRQTSLYYFNPWEEQNNEIIIDNKEYELKKADTEVVDWEPFGKNGMFAGEIRTEKYICPLCGKGYFIHVDEDTPGDRDHYSYLDCEECDPDRLIYTNTSNSSWDLRKRTSEEIEDIKRIRATWNF